MNKSELVTALTNSRKELQTVLDDLSELEMIETGVEGHWSVKDILAHLTAWEAEMVKLLVQARNTKRPAYLALTNSINDQLYEENKDRPLDRVLADFHGVRKHILRQVDGYTDKELTTPNFYKWLEGKTLAQYIASETLDHEAVHTANIKQWLENRNNSESS
jgi:hypothetical protein